MVSEYKNNGKPRRKANSNGALKCVHGCLCVPGCVGASAGLRGVTI